MAVTQYIGARYVPLFYTASDNTNKWESGVQYEPLTIVTYLNQSYTSKIPVPASVGNPADNPDYWVITGGYNSQVAQLQSDFDAFVDDTADNFIKAAAQNDKKVAIVTDSYGNTFGGTITPWTEKFRQFAGFTGSGDYWTAQLDGASFAGTTKYLTALATLVGGMTTEEKESVTDFIVAGGCNDALLNISDILTGMQTFIQTAKTNFPNARIHVAMIGGVMNSNTGRVGVASNSLFCYSYCGLYGAAYMANVNLVMTNKSYFQSDLVHPNQNGMNQIAAAMVSALYGNYENSDRASATTITRDSAFNGGVLEIDSIPIGDVLNVSMRMTTPFSYASATNIPVGNLLLGAVNDPYITGNVDQSVYCHYYTNGDNAGMHVGELNVANGSLYLITQEATNNVTALSLARSTATWIRMIS